MNSINIRKAQADCLQKPAGYVRPRMLEALRSGKARGITIESEPDAHNGATVPLYLHPQPAPDVNWLASIARDIVELHDRRGVVLTVHVEALKEALAANRKGGE